LENTYYTNNVNKTVSWFIFGSILFKLEIIVFK
jgi:hypothetical protein